MDFVFVIAFLASILFYGVILVGGVLFIRRQLRQIRSEDDGSIQHRILDEVEAMRYQVEILSDRLRRLEERDRPALGPGEEEEEVEEGEPDVDPGREEPGRLP